MAHSLPVDRSVASVGFRRLLPWYLLGLATLVIFVCILAVSSIVEGEEFNPNTFERRTYRLWRIPILGWQVTPTYRYPAETSTFRDYLKRKGWFPAASRGSVPWQVAREVTVAGIRTGDSWFISQLLENESTWIEWSDQHQERAAALWPLVLERIDQNDFVSLPRLFGLALDDSADAEWFKLLDAWRRDVRPKP